MLAREGSEPSRHVIKKVESKQDIHKEIYKRPPTATSLMASASASRLTFPKPIQPQVDIIKAGVLQNRPLEAMTKDIQKA
jgi:hypothetical protein